MKNKNEKTQNTHTHTHTYIDPSRNWFHLHQVALLARISLTLSHHSSLSSISPGRSSKLHPVSVQSCDRFLLGGQHRLVHEKGSIMSSFLLPQPCPAYFVRLIWMVLEIGGKWRYSCCFVKCCFQDLLNIARSILVQLLSSFFSMYALSASVWCIHKVVLTQSLLGINSVRFYWIDQTNIWSIAYR